MGPGVRGDHFEGLLRSGCTRRLRVECSECEKPCVHTGGLLSIVLEQKTDLGLAAPPSYVGRPIADDDVVAQALDERAKAWLHAATEPL